MRTTILFTFLIITLSVTTSAQYRPIGYLFFEENLETDTFHMYWIKGSHLIYNYRNNIDGTSDEPRRFNAVDSSKYELVDSLYLKQLDIKPPSWLFDPNINRDFGWYWDRNGNLETGPFRGLYVVEKLERNKFKIIRVVPYIGSTFEKS